MKRSILLSTLIFLIATAATGSADDFLSVPLDRMHAEERMGGEMVYFPDDVLERLPNYDSLMVDEPLIFIAADSTYQGFKASDLAAITTLLRESFIKGLSTQPVSIGHFNIVEEPGPSVLYIRMALKNLYVAKEKRGLFSYTPVGIVAHGVSDLTSDAIDKTKLVEMRLEFEMQDTEKGEVLLAGVIDRGLRENEEERQEGEEAGWDTPGAIAEILGRRLACRLDNARLAADKRVDCVNSIPIDV